MSIPTMALEIALDASHNAGTGTPVSTQHQCWLTWWQISLMWNDPVVNHIVKDPYIPQL